MSVSKRLGRYDLGDRVGEGGMGVVYRAEVEGAEGFSKTVAVKTVHEVLGRDPGIRAAFMDEARVAQRLHHGNIVQIIDLGVDGQTPYMVQEYVDGMSLSELLDGTRSSPLPIAATLYIAERVAAALAYAHGLKNPSGRAEGVVHRDVTPRNILISRDGVVKLADFGIAKALNAPSYTLPGTVKGSLGYLAPEQAAGQPVDARADQFSAGIVLHEMLTGKNPIGAKDVEGYRKRLAQGVPRLEVRGSVDPELADIVARAVALDPADRFESMHDLKHALEEWRVSRKIKISNESLRDTIRVLLGEGVTKQARPLGDALDLAVPTARTKLQKPSRPVASRRRGSAWALWAAAAGLALVVVVATWFALAGREKLAAVVGSGADAGAAAGDPIGKLDAAAVQLDAAAVQLDAAGQATVTDAAPAAAADAGKTPPAGTHRRPPVRPKPTGRLKVNVMPYANAYVDGKLIKRTPIDVDLPAGKHKLRLHNPQTGQDASKSIVIEAGKTLNITRW